MKQKLSQLGSGGMYLGMNKKQTELYYVGDDTHTLGIGATRSGKSRCLVLPTIALLAFGEESMIVTDPKAELYLYTRPFLERMGYEVITLDFKFPRRSSRYNFLQPLIDDVSRGNIALAIQRARDLVALLVPDGHTNEPIWTDGERAVIAAGILAVVYDNQDHPEHQNLTNVYHFLAKMCKPVGSKGQMPLVHYMKKLPPEHPALAVMDIAEVAPTRMRGSFFASALGTLSLFTDPNLYGMTSQTDFDVSATGERKRAIFIVLPEDRGTYYSIASLIVYQQYQLLSESSDHNGNRLKRRVNFVCDEFGNFSKIPDFTKALTVGGGKGIRFHLFVQDFNMIDEVYGQNIGKTIRSNCETWIYLKTDNGETLKEISEKLGSYTVKSPSLSGSTGGNQSASYNLTGRNLLMPDEIGQIRRPYALVTSRERPAILYAPDISETLFNRLLGLGDKEFNRALVIRRQAAREEREEIQPQDIKLWGIWTQYERLIQLADMMPKKESL